MNLEGLGAKISAARKQKGLTQEKLAEKVGISNVYMGEIERGTKIPKLPVLIAIIEALEVSADYLLQDKISAGGVYINNEITEKLNSLTPKQRAAALDILNAYIQSI